MQEFSNRSIYSHGILDQTRRLLFSSVDGLHSVNKSLFIDGRGWETTPECFGVWVVIAGVTLVVFQS